MVTKIHRGVFLICGPSHDTWLGRLHNMLLSHVMLISGAFWWSCLVLSPTGGGSPSIVDGDIRRGPTMAPLMSRLEPWLVVFLRLGRSTHCIHNVRSDPLQTLVLVLQVCDAHISLLYTLPHIEDETLVGLCLCLQPPNSAL